MTKTFTKRSRAVPVALLGAAALTLSACGEEEVQVRSFETVDQCLADAGDPNSWWTADECERDFAAARAEHERAAPRYAEGDLCEEEHGGRCTEVQQAGGGSFFMPLMMGYLMGNVMSSSSSYKAQPVYATKGGRFSTLSGTALSAPRGMGALRPSKAFQAAPSTTQVAPMTRAQVRSTGGFGASRTSVSSRGGFGG